MEIYVVSPNASNSGSEQSIWENIIVQNSVALMGWEPENKFGKMFSQDVQEGDFILIAQGSNKNKKVLLGGIVSSKSDSKQFENAPRSIFYRQLKNVLSKKMLESLDLDFVDSAYGASSQIPAIYKLYPSSNKKDKEIETKILKALLESKQQAMNNNIISLLTYKKQIILQGPPGTGKTYQANDIAESIIFGEVSEDKMTQTKKLESCEQFNIVQFHPSYSYDDFVRGIIMDTEDKSFKAKNRVFGNFCQKAQRNLNDSKKKPDVLSREMWAAERMEGFKMELSEKIKKSNGKYLLQDSIIYLFDISDHWATYRSDVWGESGAFKIFFDDIISMYSSDCKSHNDVRNLGSVSRQAKIHPGYYLRVLGEFKEYLNNFPEPDVSFDLKVEEKRFVLVIDEINRANLPSVLGELIFALEYRDKVIESMYQLPEGGGDLVIPSNLYIIGTMNTADRSVGHIDYAIRRRFAFVDVLPSIEPIKNESAKEYFKLVSELFVCNYEDVMFAKATPKRSDCLASDFGPEQVWIGHSYFITEKEGEQGDAEIRIKMKYEVLPLIKEYVKDGILNSDEKNAEDPVQTVINRLQLL